MRIFLTIPDFSLHGGIRVILEWANRLSEWHEVYLYPAKDVSNPSWFNLSPMVKRATLEDLRRADLLILTSPHLLELLDHHLRPNKVVLFCQMLEHMFRPQDREWRERCLQFYRAPFPMIAISAWNIEVLGREFGRTAATYLVGNGVNLQDFPLEEPVNDGCTILVEGWEALNPTKDVDHVAPRVAERLRKHGYRILAYSQAPLRTLPQVPHEYYVKPALPLLNDLYSRATILLKATKYDARSCGPVEAMTKGTPSCRAIILGDDDVLDGYNGVRCSYDAGEMLDHAVGLLTKPKLYLELSENCHNHLRQNGWDTWMPIIDDILCNV